MNGYAISASVLPAVLSRRKWLILLCGLLGAGFGLGLSRILPNSYVAQGALIIDTPRTSSIGSGGNESVLLTQEEILRTQEDVIRSRGLIEQVVQNLQLGHAAGLTADARLPAWLKRYEDVVLSGIHSIKDMINGGSGPDEAANADTEAAIQYVLKHLQLDSTEQSSVVSLQFAAGTKELAVSVLNAIMNTYVSDLVNSKHNEASGTSRILVERAAAMKAEADNAQKKLEAFLRAHALPEVQGSSMSALQLSRNQDQLTAALADQARKQAKLDVITHFGASALPEVLQSPTIQRYLDSEAQLLGKLALFGPSDPRRRPVESALSSIHSQIDRETEKIAAAVRRDVDIGNATIKHLEASVASDSSASQASSVAAVTLSSLKSDVEAKQQMYVAFQKSAADRTLMDMAQSPLAHILFPAAPAPGRHLGVPSLVLGLLFGILMSSAFVLLQYVFNAKIRSAMDLALATGLPVLASLPNIKGRVDNDTIRHVPAFTETLRAMCVTLRPVALDEGETILITSSESGEGKTTLAAALAETYARDGFRVLLVDSDLRRPRLATMFGLQPIQTLETVLAGNADWADAVVVCSDSGLHCLPAAGNSKNPVSAINSQHLATMIEESRRHYDYIILDSPPVLRVADSLLLAKYCQHILFVVRAGYTQSDLVSQAIHRFPDEERQKVRTLLTRVNRRDLDSGGYYGGYEMAKLEAA